MVIEETNATCVAMTQQLYWKVVHPVKDWELVRSTTPLLPLERKDNSARGTVARILRPLSQQPLYGFPFVIRLSL